MNKLFSIALSTALVLALATSALAAKPASLAPGGRTLAGPGSRSLAADSTETVYTDSSGELRQRSDGARVLLPQHASTHLELPAVERGIGGTSELHVQPGQVARREQGARMLGTVRALPAVDGLQQERFRLARPSEGLVDGCEVDQSTERVRVIGPLDATLALQDLSLQLGGLSESALPQAGLGQVVQHSEDVRIVRLAGQAETLQRRPAQALGFGETALLKA